jgi:hypothetical protein
MDLIVTTLKSEKEKMKRRLIIRKLFLLSALQGLIDRAGTVLPKE